jgi:plastocyanin
MDVTSSRSDLTDERRDDRSLTWRRLAFAAGILATIAMGLVSLAIGDLEGGAVTVGFGLSTWLLRVRQGVLGAIGLIIVSAITLYFMLAAALTNIRAGSEFSPVLTSSTLAAVSLLALLAGVGLLTRRGSESAAGPWVSVGLSALVLVGLAAWGATTEEAQGATADIHLVSENVAFSEIALTAPAGEVTVVLENKDLFWHTFTIEELGVDLRVPLGAELPVTFEAPPGEYQFICDIPGHPEAGMVGSLTVEG